MSVINIECPINKRFERIFYSTDSDSFFVVLDIFWFLNWTGDFVLLKYQEVKDCIFLAQKQHSFHD